MHQDDFGKTRETISKEVEPYYINAFNKISADHNQFLMVVENNNEIIGTCHLTIMPSLTFKGSTRMQIEAVRVSSNYLNQNIGKWMMDEAMIFAKKNEPSIIQLTSNKERARAIKFYEDYGFTTSHIGMKLYLDK